MQPRNLTDAEIRQLGYQALVERLGAVGAARFIRQHDVSEEDYLEKDGPFEGMTAEEIYEQAVRFEAETRGAHKKDEE